MKTVVHLSDLHFGRVDRAIAAALHRAVHALSPDLVCVSGDLTQRARRGQFREARAFLDALPRPQLVVPGNHDVPLFNVAARLLNPLGGYCRYITTDLEPAHADNEIVAVGINTTKSMTIKGGRVLQHELERVCRVFDDATDRAVRIIVAHHPFDVSDDASPGRFGEEGPGVVEALTRCGTDVFLTGHLHVSYAGATAARYRLGGRSAIVVEAGTATSTRRRGELNSFNVIRVEPDAVTVEHLEYRSEASGFERRQSQRFDRGGDGWFSADSR